VREETLPTFLEGWLGRFSQDKPVVVVPVFNAYTDVVECIESLIASTPTDTPILILDDASDDPRIPETLGALAEGNSLAYVRKSSNSGFVSTVNLAFKWCAPRDVVVVNSDIVVPPGWLERLKAAAYSRSTIATATPLSNHGTILSVPHRNKPTSFLPGGMTTVQVDDLIREDSLRLRPIIPTAVGHCTYYKRSALDVVGFFDEVFTPGYGEEVDFSQRAVMVGFSHVAADDLFVFHKGSRSFDSKMQKKRQFLRQSHEKIIRARYPWYNSWVAKTEADARSPLALAIGCARAALLGYRIAIDATPVKGHTTGTELLILELTRSLAKDPNRRVQLTMIVDDRTCPEDLLGVDQLVDEVITRSDLKKAQLPIFDLIHRPAQIHSMEDLALLRQAACRFVVSYLDCISFANPSYSRTWEWSQYRTASHLTFSIADGILFITHDAARDAAHQGLLIPAERSCITYVGTNHERLSVEARPLDRFSELEALPFILMLGTDFRHKNRVYALRLLRELVTKHKWPGYLVFAGPKVVSGSSVTEEAQEFEVGLELGSRVRDVGEIKEEHKWWLLENAALVLYPSIREGFGLIPFEAAAAGTPVLTTKVDPLQEVLGEEVDYLDTMDPAMGADMVWSYLSDTNLGRRQIAVIKARGSLFMWQKVANRTWDFYQRILRMPPRTRRPAEFSTTSWDHTFSKLSGWRWRQRVARGLHILRSEGLDAFLLEVRQFVLWLRT
jgi:GT2 family glycosyltransferase/glycosyltransferase involved in cell wall biosynthesis